MSLPAYWKPADDDDFSSAAIGEGVPSYDLNGPLDGRTVDYTAFNNPPDWRTLTTWFFTAISANFALVRAEFTYLGPALKSLRAAVRTASNTVNAQVKYLADHLSNAEADILALQQQQAGTVPSQPRTDQSVLDRLDALEGTPTPDLQPLLDRLTALEARPQQASAGLGPPSYPFAVDPLAAAGPEVSLHVLLGDTRVSYTVTLDATNPGPFKSDHTLELRTTSSGTTIFHTGKTGTVIKTRSSLNPAPPAQPADALGYAAHFLSYSFGAKTITNGIDYYIP